MALTDTNGLYVPAKVHHDLGHRGEVITIDPTTGNYCHPYWYCYTCDIDAWMGD